MKTLRKASFIFTLLLLLLVLSMVVASFGYRPKARLFPLVIGVPTLLMLVFLAAAEFFPRFSKRLEVGIETFFGGRLSEVAEGGNARETSETSGWVRVGTIFGWLVLLFGLVFFAGFYVASPPFLLLFFLVEAKLSWPRALAFTLAISIPIYLIFDLGLNMSIWPGAIPEIIPDFLGGGIVPPL